MGRAHDEPPGWRAGNEADMTSPGEAGGTNADEAGGTNADEAGGTNAGEAGGTTTSDSPSGATRTLWTVWRFLVIVARLMPLFVAYARDRRRWVLLGPERRTTPVIRRRRARYLREALVELGPTFVKLGQLLSTRPDVVPPEYVAVLSSLQDRVPPADWAAIERVLAAEVGPVGAAFDEFDREPISGASLGQVHVATLDGERVAVKVRRPGVGARVDADLRVLGVLLAVWRRLVPPDQARTFQRVYAEFATTIREETDYEREAAMLAAIGENLRDEDGVRVPAVVDRRSTARVLTMEYVPGTKVTDVEALASLGVDRAAVARRLLSVYTEMVLVDGVFQADPHPGNVAVQPDGTVVLYDFGMCGRLDEETRSHLGAFYSGLATGDVDALVASFEAMDAVAPDADRDQLRTLVGAALSDLRGTAGDGDREGAGGGPSAAEALDAVDLYHFPLVLPRELALLVRLATVLDGVVRTVDPDVDVAAALSAYGQ